MERLETGDTLGGAGGDQLAVAGQEIGAVVCRSVGAAGGQEGLRSLGRRALGVEGHVGNESAETLTKKFADVAEAMGNFLGAAWKEGMKQFLSSMF